MSCPVSCVAALAHIGPGTAPWSRLSGCVGSVRSNSDLAASRDYVSCVSAALSQVIYEVINGGLSHRMADPGKHLEQ